MNVFIYSKDYDFSDSLFCEEIDMTAEDGEKFVRHADVESQLAALREELATAQDDLVLFKGGLSALGEASKKLVFCARTTGGTAGPDQNLMDACASVEGVITLAGIARAMDEAEQLVAERDDLKVRLENARDRKNSIVDLQQRLADAERRNVDQSNYLRECLKRINVNQNHMFCLALDDFLNSAALNPNPEAASHDE